MSSKDSESKSDRRVGDYILLRRLGRGGMGKVYLARDVLLDRLVALKVLNGSFASDAGLVRRFRREAKAAAQLNHPNIVRVYAVREEKKVPYIAMEYVEGQTLEQRLAATGPMPWQQALDIARQVAEALACAHANGIVHRDIKPGNVLIDPSGQVRVTDFGLAKFVNATSGITSDGAFLGTPQYMSPEHCGAGLISPASDVFSLGVMLYEMLSGQRPFKGNTPMMLVRQISMDPVSPLELAAPNLPQSVYDLVNNLLDKDPSVRLASGPPLLGAIKNILALKPVEFPESSGTRRAKAPGALGRFLEWAKSRWKRIAAGSLFLLVAVVALGRLQEARRNGVAGPFGSTQYTELEASQISVRLPGPQSSLEPIDWLGDSLVALGWEPRQGNKTARVLLGAVRPENRAIETLATFPHAPGWNAARGASPELTIPHVQAASSLSGGMLAVLPARNSESGAYYQEVVLAKRVKGELQRSVLFRADPLGRFAGDATFYAGGCFGAVARPDGQAVGLILTLGTTHRQMYVAELRLGNEANGQLSRALVEGSPPILSVAYSPNGRYLAYVRVSEPEMVRFRLGLEQRLIEDAGRPDRQGAIPPLRDLLRRKEGDSIATDLCVVLLGASNGPRVLATGHTADLSFAFSPDGRLLLASVSSQGHDAPELHLYDLETPGPPTRLGLGWIGRSPWHPSGRYFLTSSRAAAGTTRIEAVFPAGYTRRVLVHEAAAPVAGSAKRGDFPTPCVSPDGKWAAVHSSEDQAPALVFINLDTTVTL